MLVHAAKKRTADKFKMQANTHNSEEANNATKQN